MMFYHSVTKMQIYVPFHLKTNEIIYFLLYYFNWKVVAKQALNFINLSMESTPGSRNRDEGASEWLKLSISEVQCLSSLTSDYYKSVL